MGLCVAMAAAACGDDEADDGAHDPTEDGRAGVDRGDEGEVLTRADVGTVLESLAQDHARARATIGPHRLEVRVDLSLVPEGDPATPEAQVGKPRPIADSVHDEIRVVWASAPGDDPRFSLAQHNDHDHGREVVVADERMYTRHEHRGWYVQPLEADVWEVWLDDAQRSVSDVLALAAARLQIDSRTRPGVGLAGADALAYELTLAPGEDPARTRAEGLRAWRKDVAISAVAGEVVVDAKSGVWLSADVRVRYSLPGPDGRALRGEAHVSGSVTPLSPETATAEVATPDSKPDPEEVTPLLERTRYEAERARLLDGLAGR